MKIHNKSYAIYNPVWSELLFLFIVMYSICRNYYIYLMLQLTQSTQLTQPY